ncbi:DNA mismatch repair protein MutT [Paenibacillus tyrfis]|uniref:(deoxy)nucleoside triphosphate pyrophosphohydrolase n=1 Tax=Paenibacillus tyrfis TaxID=1501230 RepID=UPI0024929B2F|nr:(deoxy)nucleoside triphosphate pyrophosphohydrolase [Paenibacillus tyrfis]GLI06711.1 DNA mismatch repair protein MutT [Paenibacillus tyrfis]
MIEVAAAIIENEHGQILIARRKKGKAQAGLWEFPGGKIEKNETVEECLKRELLEEMNIEIQPYEPFGVNDHYYGETHIRLHAHRAKFVSGKLILVDHDQCEWVYSKELGRFEFAPADVKFVEIITWCYK